MLRAGPITRGPRQRLSAEAGWTSLGLAHEDGVLLGPPGPELMSSQPVRWGPRPATGHWRRGPT